MCSLFKGGDSMEYFYSYLNSEEIHRIIQTKLARDYPKISEDYIYIDVNDCAQWLNLENIISHDDKLYIYEINYLADEPNCFINRLLFLKKYNIQLKILNETIIDIEQVLKTTEFVQSTIRKSIYDKQMEGIHKALEKKRNGTGDYGRPKITLPDDFEANIKKIMRKEMKHEDYREKLGFKRSTYFKFVKDLKDSWKQQELERSLRKDGKY